MLLTNKKIAIVGGGPGGLTLARLLQLKGVNVSVYERDVNADARVQGATLDLHYGSGLAAIEAAGLMDAFKANYRPGADKGRVVDAQANIVYDEHAEATDENIESEYWRPEIDRGALRDILLAALEPGTVIWNTQLSALTPCGDGWELTFKNDATTFADLVIGADGANSKIRPFVTDLKNWYTGVVIVQGNIENGQTAAPHIHELLKGAKLYAYGDNKYLHVSAKGDGSIDLYVSCKKDENWPHDSGMDFSDREQVCNWFKTEFSGWSNIWLELFEHAGLPLLIRPQYCMPLDQSWNGLANITLLGDAAHLMPPSGEGVNLAMLDALEFSQYLTNENYENIQAAIAAYEESMQSRGVAEAHDSLAMTDWMHSNDALSKMIQLLGHAG